jgi:outer membrane receptor protein involved in Fe transport
VKRFALLCSCAAIAVPFAAATVAPTAAEAQQITTSIQGQVTNEAGAPVPNATVTVTDTRTGATQTITTDSQGLFSAQNLTTGGPYTVTAVAGGFQGQTVNQINTTLQGPTQLTFALSPAEAAAAENAIVVTAARAKVTQLEVGPGTSFTTEVMQNAPSFNRDVRDIIRMDPRVSLDREDAATGGSGQDRISCLGGNDRFNTFTVDGIPQSDIYGLNDTGFSSRSSTPIPYDAVRETQVQFAPFDVEYGGFTGCAINVVTKSGTNHFHGSGFFEYSDNGLRGDTVDGNPVGPIEPEKRWGVTLGGPIIKDHLFVFGGYEHQQGGASQDEGPVGGGYPNEMPGITVDQFNAISDVLKNVYGIDTGPLVTSRPFYNDRYFGRVDWQITDRHRLEGTYQRLDETTMRSDDFFTGSSPQLTGANTFYLSGTHSKYYSGRFYSNWTDNFSTELRYSHANIIDAQDPVGGGEAQSGNPIPRIIVGVDNPPLGTSPIGQDVPDATVLAGPGTSRSANDLKTKVDIGKFVANYDAGDHKLKLGAEFNRADIFNLFVQNATGTLVFRNIADLEAGILSPGTTGTTDTRPFNVVPGNTVGAFGNFSRTGDVNDAAAAFKRTIWSFYGQDDWRVNDQLSFVLGLRTDIFSGDHPDVNPKFAERYGFDNTTGFSDLNPVVLPRLGFTYNLDDMGWLTHGKLQGGFGIFSGGDPLVWFGNAFQNNGFGFAEGTTNSAACPDTVDVVENGQFTGVPDCFRQDAINKAAQGLGDTQSIDPSIKMPTVWRANIGYQTRFEFNPSPFGRGWQLNLDYIFSHYKDPYGIVDLSQTPDIRKGLNGFTSDGRPIYAAIDPTVAGCDATLASAGAPPVWQNVTAACFNTSRDDELMLTNTDGYNTHVFSAILSKNFDGGLFTPGGSSYFTLGYAFTAANDRRNMFNSTAGSNYDLTAAVDRQNPGVSRSFYASRHNISFSGNFREKFFGDLATSLGFTFVSRAGRPYSLTFSGGGVFGDSVSGNDNALVYIPTGISDPNISPLSNMTAVQQLSDYARGLDCAKKYVGKSIKRNTCQNDWYNDLDIRLSQELPGPGAWFGHPLGMHDKITVYAMFDNFLNFLNDKWNLQHRRNFAGLQDVASLSSVKVDGVTYNGVDAQGRYIIGGFNGADSIAADNFINVSGSVWRIKVGVSYDF